MARRINSTPKKDGFRMPGEFEEQEQIFMMWPERDDTWRNGGSLHRWLSLKLPEPSASLSL